MTFVGALSIEPEMYFTRQIYKRIVSAALIFGSLMLCEEGLNLSSPSVRFSSVNGRCCKSEVSTSVSGYLSKRTQGSRKRVLNPTLQLKRCRFVAFSMRLEEQLITPP